MSSVSTAPCQMLSSHLWLVFSIMDSADTEHSHRCRTPQPGMGHNQANLHSSKAETAARLASKILFILAEIMSLLCLKALVVPTLPR